jgi:hypothetical protein
MEILKKAKIILTPKSNKLLIIIFQLKNNFLYSKIKKLQKFSLLKVIKKLKTLSNLSKNHNLKKPYKMSITIMKIKIIFHPIIMIKKTL